MSKLSISTAVAISIVLVFVILGAGLATAILWGGHNSTVETMTTSTTSQNLDGVVTGYVTVSPSQPVCLQNQSCTVDLTGYSLQFATVCAGISGNTCATRNYSTPISPSGHYSALLPAGNYSVTGLAPSCKWLGCTTTFPKTVAVRGGMQIVENFDIDTGIR